MEESETRMYKLTKRLLWLFSILTFLGMVICYFYLPDKIPIHWNNNWEVNRYADKSFIFISGALPAGMILLFDILPVIDPRRNNYRMNTRANIILQTAIVVLIILMNWITVISAFQVKINIRVLISVLMGIVFIVIGNFLPVIKSNFFVGIKNPWTLSDDLIWRKTHKVGGYVFVIIGILMIIMGILDNKIYNSMAFYVLIIGLIGVYVYSYLLYRKSKGKNLK